MIKGPGLSIFLPPKTGTTYLIRECERVGWMLHKTHHERRCRIRVDLGDIYCVRRDPFDWYESLYRYMHCHPVGRSCLVNLPVMAPFGPWLLALLHDPVTTTGGPLQREVISDLRRLDCGLATYRVMSAALEVEVSAIATARLPTDVAWIPTEGLTGALGALWQSRGVTLVPSPVRAKVSKPRDDIHWTPELLALVESRDRLLLT